MMLFVRNSYVNNIFIWNIYTFITLLNKCSGQQAHHSFEIKSLTGEPNYKSVNLTWEIEDATNNVENESTEDLVKSFTIFYCELQSWGAHRCKSKVLHDDVKEHKSEKQYSFTVNQLRMATKYSFHVKPQNKLKEQTVSGRSETGDNGNEDDLGNKGQTIVVPTKGFSAHATLCLPHASEIEVETGPYFGGRIATENGDCGVQGDPTDSKEIYKMRIEHEKCGSHVSNTELTVETFIMIQENLGILTHSARRFVVVCTFQPDTLTVRARLALPGKGGATAVANSDWWPTNGRNARERQFKMVDKSSLVLKNDPEDNEGLPQIKEYEADARINEHIADANYARLFDDKHKSTFEVKESNNYELSGILVSVCLVMIMIGSLVFLVQREGKKMRHEQSNMSVRVQ